ncbi:hypothetical protein ACVBGC_01750 [Burkholderia stagnalis]
MMVILAIFTSSLRASGGRKEFIVRSGFRLVPSLTGIPDGSLPFENPDIDFLSLKALSDGNFLMPVKNADHRRFDEFISGFF